MKEGTAREDMLYISMRKLRAWPFKMSLTKSRQDLGWIRMDRLGTH